MQRLPKGWGVMSDDIMAAIYANVTLQIILFFILKYSVKIIIPEIKKYTRNVGIDFTHKTKTIGKTHTVFDKIWKFDVIPRALIRFGNLNSDGHNSSITSSYFKKKRE